MPSREGVSVAHHAAGNALLPAGEGCQKPPQRVTLAAQHHHVRRLGHRIEPQRAEQPCVLGLGEQKRVGNVPLYRLLHQRRDDAGAYVLPLSGGRDSHLTDDLAAQGATAQQGIVLRQQGGDIGVALVTQTAFGQQSGIGRPPPGRDGLAKQ